MNPKPLWTVWQDKSVSYARWLMSTPIGVLPYHRKCDALAAKTLYERQTELRRIEEKAITLRQKLAKTHPEHYPVVV